MLHILKLLIPALIPSWNFFDVITPSPRIQFTLFGDDSEIISQWYDFRPHPAHLSFFQLLRKLFWNAKWNETMFTIGCAERLMVNPTLHSEDEILNRILNDLFNKSSTISLEKASHIQFRLLVIQREGTKLTKQIIYTSRILSLSPWKN